MRIRLTALFLLMVSPHAVADIIQPEHNSISSFFGPKSPGQSFLADASVAELLHIDFRWDLVNTHLPLPTLTMNLFEGQGFAGTLV